MTGIISLHIKASVIELQGGMHIIQGDQAPLWKDRRGLAWTRNFVSLDIGTTSIKKWTAEHMNGQVNIIGVGNEKSRGLSRGVIVDIDGAVYSIQQAIAQAEQKHKLKLMMSLWSW